MPAALQVVAVIRPDDLTRTENGKLPQLCLEEIGPAGHLHRLAARAWRALVAAAAADGIKLTYTFGGTYRTYDEQVQLFRQRYVPTELKGRPVKHWLARTWWQMPNTAQAAVPGTSNHGWGLAIDTALGDGPHNAGPVTPKVDWLAANAPRYGFSWETVPSEPWHIRYVAGDRMPPHVLLYEASLVPAAPPHVEVVAPPPPPITAPATATAPAVRTTPPEGGSTVIRILRSMSDTPEFYAQFVAVCDDQGHSIEVQWSGSGDDPRVAQRMADLRAAGIQDQHITLAGLRNNRLAAPHRPSDIQDARHSWTDADFAV